MHFGKHRRQRLFDRIEHEDHWPRTFCRRLMLVRLYAVGIADYFDRGLTALPPNADSLLSLVLALTRRPFLRLLQDNKAGLNSVWVPLPSSRLVRASCPKREAAHPWSPSRHGIPGDRPSFGPVCTCLGKSGPVWVNLGLSGPAVETVTNRV